MPTTTRKKNDNSPGLAPNTPAKPLRCMARFGMKEFVIGAWWGPDPSERNYRAYMDAGFNILMTYRNRANGANYGPGYEIPDREFALAEKLGLRLMLDTYMKHETPWGGIEPDPPPEEPMHHRARPAQLEWLLDRYGKSPALGGIMLGDDCDLADYMVENARIMQRRVPHVFPWMATNLDTLKQARLGVIPMLSTQSYTFLIKADQPEPVKRRDFCEAIEADRRVVNRAGMALWPWVVTEPVVSECELRFQVNACLAYGAQGIWYYFYNLGVWDAKKEKPGRLYATARECNRYAASIGPRIIGRRCVGVFHSADPEPPECKRPPRKVCLGIRLGDITPEQRKAYGIPDNVGLIVGNVDPELPGGKAGMRDGDVMLSLDGRDIHTWHELMDMLKPHSVGDRLAVIIHREGKGRMEKRLVVQRAKEIKHPVPGRTRFIRNMSDHLMAGLLVAEDKAGRAGAVPEYVMVVDKRTVRPGEKEPGSRKAKLEFAPKVKGIAVLGTGRTTRKRGNKVALNLRAGEGMLLGLET